MKLPHLRATRERRLVSQSDLAIAARISVATISRIEQGNDAAMGTIRKIADALDVQPADLMEKSEVSA